MDFESAKKEAQGRLADYVASVTTKSPDGQGGMWICPICGSGTHANKTGAFQYASGETWICYACKSKGLKPYSGDIFDLYGAINKCNASESFKGVFKELHIQPDGAKVRANHQVMKAQSTGAGERLAHTLSTIQSGQADKKPKGKEGAANHQAQSSAQDSMKAQADKPKTEYDFFAFKDAFESSQRAKDYLTGRGISLVAARRFLVGYWQHEDAVVFPTANESLTFRRLSERKGRGKVENRNGVELFNAGALYGSGECFICESITDALSFETCNYSAMAINGAGNTKKLFDYITINGARGLARLIVATDFDAVNGGNAGEAAAQTIIGWLKERGFLSLRLSAFPDGCKDANEYLMKAGQEAFSEYARAQADKALSLDKPKEKDKSGAAQSYPDAKTIRELAGQVNTNLFVLDNRHADKLESLYKDTGELFVTVDTFNKLANGGMKAGVAFCCDEIINDDKATIGGKREIVSLYDKATAKNLFNVTCGDFESTFFECEKGDKTKTQKRIDDCKQKLSAQRLEIDEQNCPYHLIESDILNYDPTKIFITKTFGKGVGFTENHLATIVARAGTGKTAALCSIAIEALEQNETLKAQKKQTRRVIFISIEELARQIFVRLVLRRYAGQSLESKAETLETLNGKRVDNQGQYIRPANEVYIAMQRQKTGQTMTKRELSLLAAKDWIASKMTSGELFIGLHENTAQVEQYLRNTARQGDIVFLDYIQIAKPKENEKDRFNRVENVSRELTAIAKAQGVILIAAAQANREGAAKEGDVEKLSPDVIRDSDAILQDVAVGVGIGAEKHKGDEKQKRFYRQYKNRTLFENTQQFEMDFALGYSYIAEKLDANGNPVPFKEPFEEQSGGKRRKTAQSKSSGQEKGYDPYRNKSDDDDDFASVEVTLLN